MADEEKLLAEFPLFKSFSQAELKELVEKSQVKTFAAGEAIIRFGQPGRFLGIMLDGEAEAVVADETGSVKLTLWNEQIDQINVGDNIKIENGYVTSFKSEIQLNVGKFGKLTVE